jgi:membrane associated rhomboid family serine protease
MRRSPFDSRLTATVLLLLANVVAFIAQIILARFSYFPTNHYFALSPAGLKQGYLWQLVTYAFMHNGPWHLLFNCFAIYVFGRAVEQAIGRKAFVGLYFASGIVGGLVQTLFGLVLGRFFAASVVGASAAAFGLAAAYAMLFPDRVLLLFFIIPMRAKYLLALSGALALYGILFATDNIAHAAHLGGILTGILFVRYALNWDWHWPRLRRVQKPPPRRLVKVSSRPAGTWGRGKADEDVPAEEFLSKEVDPILEKISAHGIQSLTARERGILEVAREKMAKR